MGLGYARDFFDRARAWAAVIMLLSGITAILGSTMDWVTISERPALRRDTSFAQNQSVRKPRVTQPFSGIEAGDGWASLSGGALLVAAAALLVLRRRALWGWLGLLGSVLVGAVALADYRGIGDLSSSISRHMDIVGGAEPALGIVLVVAAAIAGVVGSVAGIAASPYRRAELPTSA